ncbi:MAG: DUF1178 family protein, partial [Burkholderiaceae bacterium]|nr:DUF1178 family protein [Burkholderiaceae bacterium]
IRGTATPEERQELIEEGIAVMPLPDFFSGRPLAMSVITLSSCCNKDAAVKRRLYWGQSPA